ncbi:PREDICTED: protein rogdi homolog isoform X2 [Hipposideros armiger]|uniref:Protein rogdi homolog n=2 Tax=Rhinolophoidea TaxID=3136022 RepID=A0A8B7SUP3_HIPAR|nr:PREDICTED: protein rogdi homolog isoform X2 [Hipposideros armiger]
MGGHSVCYLCKCSLSAHSHTSAPSRGELPLSWPLFPFICLFLLDLSSCFLTSLFIPCPPPPPSNGQGIGNLRPLPPPHRSGWGLSHHTHPVSAPGSRAQSGQKQEGIPLLAYPSLAHQDVNLKMPRNNQLLHFAFREDKQWKLQQIQDARNHVSQAIYLLDNRDENYQFRTGAEVLKLMDAVMLQLTRARNRLTTPATLTLPEIAASGLTRMFAPALPSDVLVNVYINLNKLCLTVYQLHALQPNSTKNFRPSGGSVLHSPGAMFEWGSQRLEVSHVHKVESVIPWLNDALVFFTVSLQLCQQLKDKISVFSSYWSYRPF